MKAIRTIGFTGTIASGKSSRCKRLVEVAKEHQRVLDTAAAAAHTIENKPTLTSHPTRTTPHTSVLVHYINADLVGHNIYEPGKPCYQDLVRHFGSAILSRTTSSNTTGTAAVGAGAESSPKPIANEAPSTPTAPLIDRRVLGDIVFSDEHKLQELNAICWPYITAAICAEYAAVVARATGAPLPANRDPSLHLPPSLQNAAPAAPADVALIIIEAALLCEMTDVLRVTTDLWMTHCTPPTAVDRLMARNGLSREAAEQRVASQREVSEKLQALRELSYQGEIEVFDTTQVSLEEGLKETEKAFEKYWKKKVMVHLPENAIA